jgi:hypothetical protein
MPLPPSLRSCLSQRRPRRLVLSSAFEALALRQELVRGKGRGTYLEGDVMCSPSGVNVSIVFPDLASSEMLTYMLRLI